jgi:hypothetical protein
MPEKDGSTDAPGAWRSDPDTVERRDRERPDSGAPADEEPRGRSDRPDEGHPRREPNPRSTGNAGASRASGEKGHQ